MPIFPGPSAVSVDGVPINPSSVGATTPVDSISGFNITAGGSVNGVGNVSGGYLLSNSTVYIRSNIGDIKLGASDDVILARAAANTLALRNGTNGQTLVISRTYTDPGNKAEVAHILTGSTYAFTTQEAGTGVGTITGYSFDKAITAPNIIGSSSVVGAYVIASIGFQFASSSNIFNSSNGVIRLVDNADADFGRLQLGGTTIGFPAVARSGSDVEIVKADGTQVDTAIILASPNGTRYRITASNIGVVTTTAL